MTVRTVRRKVVKSSDKESLEVKKIRLYSVFSILKAKYNITIMLASLKKVLKIFMFMNINMFPCT